MPLTTKQKQLIIDVNNQVNAIVNRGDDAAELLVSMVQFMPGIKTIMESSTVAEMQKNTRVFAITCNC